MDQSSSCHALHGSQIVYRFSSSCREDIDTSRITINSSANVNIVLTSKGLDLDGVCVLKGLGDGWRAEPDAANGGAFLIFTADRARPWQVALLGRLPGMERFVACYRFEPFWMLPAFGSREEEIPRETQYILVKRSDGTFLLIVPLVAGVFRCTLRGRRGALEMTAESGDGCTAAAEVLGVYIAVGRDPYALMESGAAAVATRLGAVLRDARRLPDFVDEFGWCTWDAFYRNVSKEGVREGLSSLAAVGAPPRWMVLDDGWLDWGEHPPEDGGGERLHGLTAGKNFPEGLAPVTHMAKKQFGVRRFLVWHALLGYWSGVDGTRLTGYDVRETPLHFSADLHIQSAASEPNSYATDYNCDHLWWGSMAGLVPPGQIGRFYDDFHRQLAAQGVDGVKVDVQATLGALGQGVGGRVHLARAYYQALQESVERHLGGTAIYCMASCNETFYLSRNALQRTSPDFYPGKPHLHGRHLLANAHVGMWFGEFVHPDWDMFQSADPSGSFHAAARAICGGPVYVSDRPGTHDAVVLSGLVCSDGTVLRALDHARPTLGCLFSDCLREPIPLTIANRNATGWVIGAFDCRLPEKATNGLRHHLLLTDVPGIQRGDYIVRSHRSGAIVRVNTDGALDVDLLPGGWDILTLAPLAHGIAVIGLSDKLNGNGAVTGRSDVDGAVTIKIRASGKLLVWCEQRPTRIAIDGVATQGEWRAPLLCVDVPPGARRVDLEG